MKFKQHIEEHAIDPAQFSQSPRNRWNGHKLGWPPVAHSCTACLGQAENNWDTGPFGVLALHSTLVQITTSQEMWLRSMVLGLYENMYKKKWVSATGMKLIHFAQKCLAARTLHQNGASCPRLERAAATGMKFNALVQWFYVAFNFENNQRFLKKSFLTPMTRPIWIFLSKSVSNVKCPFDGLNRNLFHIIP